MNKIKTVSALTAALTLAGGASASTIALSASDTSASDAVALNLNQGDSATIYVWVTPDAAQAINGFSLDITSSDTSVLEATDYTTYNFGYFGGAIATWDTPIGEGTLGDLVEDTNAVAATGFGIQQIQSANYAGTTDGGAFLVAELTFDATAVGTTTLSISEGASLLTDGATQFTPSFVGGTVSVVPEPTSLALLGLGSLLIARRRRG